jgi:hypothetical protein
MNEDQPWLNYTKPEVKTQNPDQPWLNYAPAKQGSNLGGVNRGIAQMFGSFADLSRYVLNGFGAGIDKADFGTESIINMMDSVGVPTTPHGGWKGFVSNEIGANLAGFGIVGGALRLGKGVVRLTSKVTDLLSKSKTNVQITNAVEQMQAQSGGVFNSLVNLFSANPGKILAVDLSVSPGSGALGYVGGNRAAEIHPDLRATGEFLGRLVGAGGTVGAVALTKKVAGKTFSAMDEALGITPGSKERAAAGFMEDQMAHPNQTKSILSGSLGDLPTHGRATTGQLTNDPGLLAYEHGMASRSPRSVGMANDYATIQNKGLKGGLDPLSEGRGSTEKTLDYIQNTLFKSVSKLEKQAQRAFNKSNELVARLIKKSSIDEISVKSRGIIDDSLRIARKEETALWNKISSKSESPTQEDAINNFARSIKDEEAVPGTLTGTTSKKGMVDTDGVVVVAESIIDDMGKFADPMSIHPLIYRIAGRKMPKGLFDEYGTDVSKLDDGSIFNSGRESISDLQDIRTRVLDIIRAENAAGNFNRARVLKKISRSLIEDVKPLDASSTKVMDDWKIAREYSARLNSIYTEGPVGDVLGYSTKGGLKVAPEVTLDKIIAPGVKGKIGNRALSEMSENRIRDAVRDFLEVKFASESIDSNGTFSPKKARDFIKKYSVLDDYPELKTRFSDVASAEELTKSIASSYLRRAKRLREISLAARYTKGEPAIQADSVFGSKTPLTDARKLMNRAKRGGQEVVNGMRGAFYEAMMRRIAPDRAKFDLENESFLNPKLLRDFITKHSATVREVWGEHAVKLLKEVSYGADMGARKQLGVAPGGGSDTSQKLQSAAGNIGAVLGGKYIPGHVLIASGIGKRFLQRIMKGRVGKAEDSIMDLVERALYHPEMARTLLATPNARNLGKIQEWLGFPVTQAVSDGPFDDRRP